MKALVARTAKGPESLAIENIASPGPLGSGCVRIAMRAASLNYRDWLFLSGVFGEPGPQGLIPCSDGAGDVIEVAPDVIKFKVGDRVAPIFNPEWIGGPYHPRMGGLGRGSMKLQGIMCEQLALHHSELVHLPAHLSYEEGASYACAGVTAWHALCGSTALLPGMTVLTQGGGGVSLFALQFAKLFGARVIMTSSSPERCARLKALGADEVIDYRADPEWHKTARAITDGVGVDLAIDIGGEQTVERSLAATRVGGRLALVGLITGWPNAVSSMFSSGVDITSVKVGSRADYEALNRAVSFHKQRPMIDRRFAFEQFPDALRYLKSGRHLGKIVVNF